MVEAGRTKKNPQSQLDAPLGGDIRQKNKPSLHGGERAKNLDASGKNGQSFCVLRPTDLRGKGIYTPNLSFGNSTKK